MALESEWAPCVADSIATGGAEGSVAFRLAVAGEGAQVGSGAGLVAGVITC